MAVVALDDDDDFVAYTFASFVAAYDFASRNSFEARMGTFVVADALDLETETVDASDTGLEWDHDRDDAAVVVDGVVVGAVAVVVVEDTSATPLSLHHDKIVHYPLWHSVVVEVYRSRYY